MPAPSELSSHARRRGLGDCPSKPAVKPGYCPDIHLTDDHPCAPSLPPQIFSSSNTELWPATPGEHHDFFPAWEHPPKQQQQQHQHLAPPASHAAQGTSHAELTRLSTREYALRAADPSDFASAWENSIMPLLSDLLQKHFTGDFAVDVHNFPEMSSDAVPRVIYITLSTDGDTTALEQTVRAELARAVPEQFNPVYLKFRKGGLRRSTTTTTWWGQQDAGEEDAVCAPKNVTYKPTPVIGMSIGPSQIPDAASLGGFVKVGSELYAMSAYHAFEDSIRAARLQVRHPADPDFPLIVPADPHARQYSIGSVASYSPLGTFRPSLTFQGRGFAEDKTMVELDYCLIGPAPEGQNVVPVPCFDMGKCVAVEGTATVEGNTEVYAMARTSGYSLGFTSDVPGLQKISGHLRREWTVRQYTPSRNPTDGRVDAPWQTLKQWVTSGIGVPGDSGAWLIRRSDNAVVGLIWGRNYNTGDPAERIRLTYFTPIVDILADVKQKFAGEQEVVLPVYQPQDLSRSAQARGPQEVVALEMSEEPWSAYAQDAIRGRRQAQAGLIRSHFVGANVPASAAVLDRQTRDEEALPSNGPPTTRVSNLESIESSVLAADPATTPPRSEGGGSISTLRSRERLLLGLELNSAPDSAPDLSSLPELSTASSIPSGSSVEDGNFDVAPDGVRIVGEELDGDEDITEVIEAPIRTKASFSSRHPGSLGFGQLLI